MNKSIEDIYKELFATYEMDVRPKTKKVKEGTVIDEDKSVKWNREEVKRLNDAYVEEAREALKIDWNAKIRDEIDEYIDSKPNENQISLANAISLALKKNQYFCKHTTKSEYDKFIKDNMKEYKTWLRDHDPSNFGY